LACPVFHRQVSTDEVKRAILEQLTSGSERVFIATNVLRLGIDIPRIRVVVHVD